MEKACAKNSSRYHAIVNWQLKPGLKRTAVVQYFSWQKEESEEREAL